MLRWCTQRVQNQKPHWFDGCSVPWQAALVGQLVPEFLDFTGDINEPIAGVRFSRLQQGAFSGACDLHDACYQTCSTDPSARELCDAAFLETAKQSCQNANLSRNYEHSDGTVTDLLLECEGIADTYHFFLRRFGESAFDERQRQYCQCCS